MNRAASPQSIRLHRTMRRFLLTIHPAPLTPRLTPIERLEAQSSEALLVGYRQGGKSECHPLIDTSSGCWS
jgi:hypothetical protein